MKGSKKLLFIILLSALVLRLALLLIETQPLRSDSLTYHQIAVSILGGEYSLDGRNTALVVPGYPVFLAGIYRLFGDGQFGVRLVQCFLDVITCLLFFLVCRNIFDEKYSLIALSVFAFFPSNALYTQSVLTESLFGLFAMLVLLSVMRGSIDKKIVLTGILFGAAILVRSSFSISVLLVPFYLFIYKQQLFGSGAMINPAKHSLYFITGVILILSPWMIRNKQVMGAFTLATQGGSTLWEGNNPKATGTWNKQAADENPLFEDPDEVRREKEFRKQAVEFILSNPLRFIELGFRKLGYLFSSERMALLYFMDSPAGMTSSQVYKTVNPVYMAVVNIPFFVVMLAGAWGLLMPFRHKFFVVGFISAWMITMFVFVAVPRYHYVLIPFFVIAATNLLQRGTGSVKTLPLRSKMAGIVFTIFLLGVWISEFYILYFRTN
jgi:4-amino-4-deoxy-L-arabinose transferase-like glycosyltransferase